MQIRFMFRRHSVPKVPSFGAESTGSIFADFLVLPRFSSIWTLTRNPLELASAKSSWSRFVLLGKLCHVQRWLHHRRGSPRGLVLATSGVISAKLPKNSPGPARILVEEMTLAGTGGTWRRSHCIAGKKIGSAFPESYAPIADVAASLLLRHPAGPGLGNRKIGGVT